LYKQIVKNPKVGISSVRDPTLKTTFISMTVSFVSSTNLLGHLFFSEPIDAFHESSVINTSMRKENEIISRWDIRM